ncbi:MAG TPA: YicC/YloC family endoribonuclease [Gemmatimonadaceae bacterium]|nr:YicC/YloC family endoribonuclease [Gemmatimonadaceae bacterium]
MTGFGSASGRVGSSRVAVELRSVNHRFLNPNVKLPPSLAKWEGEVRELLRGALARGHVTVSARFERDGSAGTLVNEVAFGEAVRQLRALQERFTLGGELDVATVLRMPDVLADDEGAVAEGSAAELAAIVKDALGALLTMRAAEGKRLAELLGERLTVIEQLIERIAARAPERLTSERERMRTSVRELASGVDVDEARLAQEIAVLADRLDVSEEIDRFRAHVAAFRDALDGEKGPVGKRLGFLLQEMLREANTTGSKARDSVMLHDVVAVKEELERIAEQVENVE